MHRQAILRRRVRWLLGAFVVALVLSGLTAFPLEWEADVLARVLGIAENTSPDDYTGVRHWVAKVREGLVETYDRYPFVAYGTDWLAFAHLVIAVAFIGPLRDPVRNVWVIEFGMIACLMVVPLALICGPLRGIPLWWQAIDCSFGVVGIIPLAFAWKYAHELERQPAKRNPDD